MIFKHAEYILTIMQEGSITGASKKLYITQPALSQAVKQIEQELGAQIFDRTADPIALTHVGEFYVKAARECMDVEMNLRSVVANAAKEIHGKIRLGIPNQREQILLPLVLPDFTKKYPFVQIELIEEGSATLERMTAEGQCDMTLIATTPKNKALEYVLIQNEAVVLLAATSTELAHKYKDGEPIDIRDAVNENFVSMQSGHSVRVIQDKLFSDCSIKPHILLETNNMTAAKGITAKCNAVMLFPYVYILNVHDDLSYRLQCHPLKNDTEERHFYMVHRKHMMLPVYMQDFVEIMCRKLGVPCPDSICKRE